MANPANISSHANFQNAHLGTGVVTYNGVDLGILKGDIKWQFSPTILDLMVGTPQVLMGSGMTELKNELTIPMAEFSPQNVAIALGGYTVQANTGAATPVTGELLTFGAEFGSGSLQKVALDGPTITSLVVKNAAGTVTYTLNTDYLLDSVLGIVYANPGGAITAGEQCSFSYSYTAPVGNQLNLGSQFSLQLENLVFVHSNATGVVAGVSTVTITMWKARFMGKIDTAFKEKEWSISELVASAVYDTTHPNNPLGTVAWS